MRIYFIGYMAAGKSSLGKKTADAIGYEFVDLDEMFEAHYRISVSDFFEKYGEGCFRKLEQELLHATLLLENTLISTGGGTPCFFDNMEVIAKGGYSVYLQWEPDILAVRLNQLKMKRPLLKDLSHDQLEERVRLQLKEREVWYLQANLIHRPEKDDFNQLVQRLQSVMGD